MRKLRNSRERSRGGRDDRRQRRRSHFRPTLETLERRNLLTIGFGFGVDGSAPLAGDEYRGSVGDDITVNVYLVESDDPFSESGLRDFGLMSFSLLAEYDNAFGTIIDVTTSDEFALDRTEFFDEMDSPRVSEIRMAGLHEDVGTLVGVRPDFGTRYVEVGNFDFRLTAAGTTEFEFLDPSIFTNTALAITFESLDEEIFAPEPVFRLVGVAAPEFTKSFSPDTIGVFGTSTLTFTIDNTANSVDAMDLAFSDTLPAGVTIHPVPNTDTTCLDGEVELISGGEFSFSGGTADAGESCTVQINVTSGTVGAHVNVSSELTSSLGSSGPATATLIVSAPDLFDYGDAPTAAISGFASDYPTLLPDGARHTPSSLFLGATIDGEMDGQPTVAADGDGADEDGVKFVTTAFAALDRKTTASLLVTASAPGKLDGWIDFNRDGDWLDPGEELFATSVDLAAGPNVVPYEIPVGLGFGGVMETYARFRISSAGDLDPSGPADDGEVEDYRMRIHRSKSPAVIDMEIGDLKVGVDLIELVVRHQGVDVFRAPNSFIQSHEYIGTPGDNELQLGNLSTAFFNPLPLVFEGGDGDDTLVLTDSNQTLDLTNATLTQLDNLEKIDIVGASPNELILNGASVVDATDTRNTLHVVHDDDDTVDYSGAGWDIVSPVFDDSGQRHVVVNGNARVEVSNQKFWQNPLDPLDANLQNGRTTLDALVIMNFLGRFDTFPVVLPSPPQESEFEFYYDVDGDGNASGRDALLVINDLAIIQPEEELVLRPSRPTHAEFADEDEAESVHRLAGETNVGPATWNSSIPTSSHRSPADLFEFDPTDDRQAGNVDDDLIQLLAADVERV